MSFYGGYPQQGFAQQQQFGSYAQPMYGQPMYGQPMPMMAGQPATSAAPATVVLSGAPVMSGAPQVFAPQPFGAQPFGAQPYGAQPYGAFPGQAPPQFAQQFAQPQFAAPQAYGSYTPYGGHGAAAYAADPYQGSPYGAGRRSIYRPRRNERYGEILYSAPIWDDRDEHTDGRVPAAQGNTRAAPVSAAPASSGSGNAHPSTEWVTDIEVVAARGLPATMGGTFRKDKLDPYVVVKVGGQQAHTREKKDAGSEALFGDKLHFRGSGARPTTGTLSVYDCDGEMKAGAAVPGKSDDLIGTANFNIVAGDQNIPIQDPKKGATNGTVTIRVL